MEARTHAWTEVEIGTVGARLERLLDEVALDRSPAKELMHEHLDSALGHLRGGRQVEYELALELARSNLSSVEDGHLREQLSKFVDSETAKQSANAA